MTKIYRVWRIVGETNGDPKYDGFTELEASSPEEAVKVIEDEDWKTRTDSDAIVMKYAVDQIADLSGDGAVVKNCGEF